MVTVVLVVVAALLSRSAQVFLAVMVGWNLGLGLVLTFDIREWLHRLHEVLPFCVYVGELTFIF